MIVKNSYFCICDRVNLKNHAFSITLGVKTKSTFEKTQTILKKLSTLTTLKKL